MDEKINVYTYVCIYLYVCMCWTTPGSIYTPSGNDVCISWLSFIYRTICTAPLNELLRVWHSYLEDNLGQGTLLLSCYDIARVGVCVMLLSSLISIIEFCICIIEYSCIYIHILIGEKNCANKSINSERINNFQNFEVHKKKNNRFEETPLIIHG